MPSLIRIDDTDRDKLMIWLSRRYLHNISDPIHVVLKSRWIFSVTVSLFRSASNSQPLKVHLFPIVYFCCCCSRKLLHFHPLISFTLTVPRIINKSKSKAHTQLQKYKSDFHISRLLLASWWQALHLGIILHQALKNKELYQRDFFFFAFRMRYKYV